MDKCPKCGNRVSRMAVLCPRCGSVIDKMRIADPTPPDSAEFSDPLVTSEETTQHDNHGLEMYEVSEFAEDVPDAPKDAYLEIEEVGETDADIVSDEDADYQEAKRKDAEVQEELWKLAATSGNADLPALSEEPAESEYVSRRYKANVPETSSRLLRKKRPVALVLLAWVIAAAALFAGFFYLDKYIVASYGSFNAFVRTVTNGKIELDTGLSMLASTTVTVSKTQTDEGEPAHRFDVALRDGKSVRVLPLGETFPMDGGRTSFTVADEALAATLGVVTYDATVATNGVNLEISTPARTFHYPVSSLTLSLRNAEYSRTQPAKDVLTTQDDTVAIVLNVAPDATVYINNDNYSDDVNKNGRLNLSLPLETLGDNYFVVDVIQSGRRAIKDSFTVTRTQPQVSLVPAAAYLNVSDTAFEITGTTAPGATVSATLGDSVFTGEADETGAYTLACEINGPGLYPFAVKASAQDHADAEVTVMVELLPDSKAFMSAAKTKSVRQLKEELGSLNETGVKVSGTVSGLTVEADKQTFKLVSKDDAVNCYYYGTVQLKQDASYTLYGKADPATSSFYVMFVEK